MGNVAIARDWPRLQEVYVTSESGVSLRQLAKIEDVPFRTLSEHSRLERWPEKRQEYHNAVASRTQSLVIQRTALARVETIDVVDTAIDLASAQLVSMSEALAGKSWETAEPQEIARASASVTTALEKIAKLKRLINGESTENAQVCLSTLLAQVRSE